MNKTAQELRAQEHRAALAALDQKMQQQNLRASSVRAPDGSYHTCMDHDAWGFAQMGRPDLGR